MSRDAYGQKLEKGHMGTGGVFGDEAQFGKDKTAEPSNAPQRVPLNRDGRPPQTVQSTAGKQSGTKAWQKSGNNTQTAAPDMQSAAPGSPRNTANHGTRDTDNSSTAAGSVNKRHKQPAGNNISTRAESADTAASDTQSAATENAGKFKTHHDSDKFKTDRDSGLHFKPGESASVKPDKLQLKRNRKLIRAEAQAQKALGKLEKAKNSLPMKHRLRIRSFVDEETGIVKRRLKFEKTPMPMKRHVKGPLPLRPVKAAGNAAIIHAHRKIYQAEDENVAVKAAHRAEMSAEAGTRTALHFKKTAPYKKAAKLERKATKKSINLTYRKNLAENPKLKSNIFSRMAQKRRIKRDYAKAAREAKKAANKAASATKKIGQMIAKHPFIAVMLIIAILLVLLFVPTCTTCASMAGSTITSMVMSTYLAADDDMYAAEEAYAAMEAGLQDGLDNYETLHPGYDEYVYELDGIEHDPYVLMSMLHALHEGVWTVGDVQGTLAMLFDRQYTLTETVTVETRYRTVTVEYIDPYTGIVYEVEELEEYDYYICTVELINFNLSHVPVYIMSEAQLSRYATLMATLGNRPDLFPTWQYPNASTPLDFEMYDIPQAYLDADPRFAAIIAEANKYLGMPYVWGGSSPSTSFDCSGFVSWVLNQTGWDIGRLGARGLHSMSTNVSKSQARPGDLVFFNYTYRAEFPEQATHVGIYVGDGMMIHCGNPISYTSIETKYWQDHFLAFGRIY